MSSTHTCRYQTLTKKTTDGRASADQLKVRMGEIVKNTLLSTRHSVSPRDGSFMVLGFDFMVDAQFKVWLIEANTSPSNELSTPVTTKVIEDFQRDQAKLFLDFGVFGKERQLQKDIGKFRLLFAEPDRRESLRDRIVAQQKENL